MRKSKISAFGYGESPRSEILGKIRTLIGPTDLFFGPLAVNLCQVDVEITFVCVSSCPHDWHVVIVLHIIFAGELATGVELYPIW